MVFYQISAWIGVASFLSLGLLIFSGDTARLWDRFFGIDRIIKFQRKFSIFISIILLSHPVILMIINKQFFAFIIPNFSSTPLSIGIISFYLFIVVMTASVLYKRISYKSWQYIHFVNYVIYFFAFYHAINIGSDADLLAPIYWFLSILVILGFIYRTIYKIRIWLKGPAKVIRLVNETHDSYSIYVKPVKKISFKPGQFCFLRLDLRGLHARHPFTIASAPEEEELRFTIKLKGRFTKIASSLMSGESIYVDGPFGIFTPPINRDIVCIAGGVGITPFMSIIKNRIINNGINSLILFYACKDPENLIYFNELNTMNYPWLKIVYVLENSNNFDKPYESGFISANILKKYVPNIDNKLYYICGPEPMKDAVIGQLLSLGVSRSYIKKEDFFW